MSCANKSRDFEPELTAYVDGELSAADKDALESHLPACASCQRTLSLLQRTTQSLAALPDFAPSVALRRQVLSRLDEAPGGLAGLWQRLSRPRVMMPSFGLVAAALVAGIFLVSSEPPLPQEFELEIAANMEVVEDYELLGLSELEDLEVVQNLHELEDRP
jgi:anti-sigma factor RsiW